MDVDSLLTQASSAHTRGALEDAELLYLHLLEHVPNHTHAMFLLGVLYLQTGRYLAATAELEHFLALNPNHPEALLHLAFANRESGNVSQAEACYRQLISLDPTNAQAHFGLAELCQSLDRQDQALAHYRETVRLAPSTAEAWFNQGVLHLVRREFPEAEAAYRQAIALRPNNVEAHYNLGALLHDQNRLDEALAEYQQSLVLKPGLAEAYRGIADIYLHKANFSAALDNYRQAYALEPGNVELINNMGVALQKLGQNDKALDYFRESLRYAPENINAHFNLALVLLLKGNFAEGWVEYEWRHRIKDRVPVEVEQPEWDGTSFAGKTILIRAERGYGDTFQFMRYLKLVKAMGGRVVFECQVGLQRLLRGVEGVDEIFQKTANGHELAQFDMHIALLGLPRVLHTELANIPAQVPYLKVELWLAERWRARLSADTNFKIGIVWAGRPTHEDDRNRSAVLSDFLKLTLIPGISLYSLQKGVQAEIFATLPSDTAVINLDLELDDFADTAAAITHLDLVISVDTSVAHLAGALGKAVWVLLPFAPDWRWLTERENCPWYPTMRLFRQPKFGDWDGVFAQVSSALTKLKLVSERPDRQRSAAGAAYSTDILALLQRALISRKQSDDVGVIAACQGILVTQPQHAEANYLAGIASLRRGEYATAYSYLTVSAATWPAHPGMLKHLGMTCQALGKLEEASRCFASALALGNEEVELLFNLGAVRLAQGEAQEAVNWFARALAYEPAFVEAHNNLGLALRHLGRHEEAIEQFRQALQSKADFYDAQLNLANALCADGKVEEAESIYRAALQQLPNSAALHNGLGVALKTQEKFEEALVEFRCAIEQDPKYGEAFNNLGNTLKLQGDLSGAAESYRQALHLDSRNATAWNNLGNTLQAQGNLQEALACFDHALEISPDFADAHWNRSIALLLAGDYEQGWREYEWGFAAGHRPLRQFDQSRWQGENFAGKTLLVFAEQGFGDTLQFIRFLPMVKARGGRVVLECQPELEKLIKSCAGIDEIIHLSTTGQVTLPFDLQVPLMSLALVLQVDLETLPARPYLRADPSRVLLWRERMHAEGLKVGVVWAGNAIHQDDHNRSMPVKMLEPLTDLKEIALYSLQKGMAAETIADIPGIIDLAGELHDFADTAAAIANLDLVITVDTAVAHLAGALGRPAWVMLPVAPDWRWLCKRRESPWYPSLRLFRQGSRGNWGGVIAEVRARLRTSALTRKI
jgi:tetratricopeptide (TPR) repeat protein